MGELVLVILVALIFGAITEVMGEKKGIDGCFWWGLFLGIIGVIVVSMKKKKTRKKLEISK